MDTTVAPLVVVAAAGFPVAPLVVAVAVDSLLQPSQRNRQHN